MKLVVELSEKDVQVKLDEMLGQRVSKLTDNYIGKKVASVIDAKLERIDIERLFSESAEKLIKSQFGEPSGFNGRYAEILRSEACKLLAERLNKSGLDRH
jgi:hypothetical protein